MLQRHLLAGPVKIGVGANRAATANLFFEKYGYLDCRGSKFFERTYLDQKVGSHISSEKIGVAILDDGMQVWQFLSFSLHAFACLIMYSSVSPSLVLFIDRKIIW